MTSKAGIGSRDATNFYASPKAIVLVKNIGLTGSYLLEKLSRKKRKYSRCGRMRTVLLTRLEPVYNDQKRTIAKVF